MSDIFSKAKSDQEAVSHSPQINVTPCFESSVFMHILNDRIAKLEQRRARKDDARKIQVT